MIFATEIEEIKGKEGTVLAVVDGKYKSSIERTRNAQGTANRILPNNNDLIVFNCPNSVGKVP